MENYLSNKRSLDFDITRKSSFAFEIFFFATFVETFNFSRFPRVKPLALTFTLSADPSLLIEIELWCNFPCTFFYAERPTMNSNQLTINNSIYMRENVGINWTKEQEKAKGRSMLVHKLILFFATSFPLSGSAKGSWLHIDRKSYFWNFGIKYTQNADWS